MTDNQQTSDLALRALAAFVHEVRPDFDAPGVLAALRARRDSDPWQLAQAMIRRASDPGNLTPSLQPFDFDGTTVGCRLHPGASVRTDGTCGVCFAERMEAPPPVRELVEVGHPLRAAVEAVREGATR